MQSYFVPDTAYDELGRGKLPEHWQSLIHFFTQTDLSHTPAPEQLRSAMLVRDIDVERPWVLDPIPFTLAPDEWREIEKGLAQRAVLLNRIIADLYGQKRLLDVGGLPPALIYGNPRFLLGADKPQVINQTFLNILAFDLGRSPDGQWRVLADWTEAPQGLGICLENRTLSGQVLPQLFEQFKTQRLANFFTATSQYLHSQAAAATHEGITVIMSPGPDHPSYFEHAYLGQYFGFPVVEGADLTVRGHTLQLKTLEGLKAVGCVLRYASSTHCDPLYLSQHGNDGVAGLVNIARKKHVHIANALGSGVLENDAFMSFLPGLCETLLNEELLLPSLASWWCGQPSAAEFVAANSAQLSVGPAFTRPELFSSTIAQYQWPQTSQRSATEPAYLDVARELIQLSHAPYLDSQGQLAAGPLVLRLFVTKTSSGYSLMPGGIARVATPDKVLSKDIWIPKDIALHTLNFTTHTARDNRLRHSDRDLPSRTADDLFWLGRYLERCEGVVRVYRCLFNHVAEGELEQQHTAQTILRLLVNLDMIPPSLGKTLLLAQQTNQDWWSPLLGFENRFGLARLLGNIDRLANQVRGRLSGDTWRMFRALTNTPSTSAWLLGSISNGISLMDGLIECLSGLSGQVQENMTRSYGWRLLELGRRLERGQFGLQLTSELVSKTSSSSHMFLLLDLCDCTITYRARYQSQPILENLLHLLLLDEANPRSLIYQVSRLQNVMHEMPLDQANDGLSDSQRILLSAYHELTLAEPEKLATVISKTGNRTQLRRVIQRLDKTFDNLSELVTATYFSHTLNPMQTQ